jgi:hypothetical protein
MSITGITAPTIGLQIAYGSVRTENSGIANVGAEFDLMSSTRAVQNEHRIVREVPI